MPTLQQVADYFRNHVDWVAFYSAVDTIGDTLNDLKNRFDKSDLLELAIEVFSHREIRHVNQTGRDFFIKELNIYCEMKFQKTLLYSTNGQQKETTTLTLVNTMGRNDNRQLPKDYADFLLAVDLNGCAVVEKKVLIKFLDNTSDTGQIKAKNIPKNFFANVQSPEDIGARRQVQGLNYSQEKRGLQIRFLEQFLPTC